MKTRQPKSSRRMYPSCSALTLKMVAASRDRPGDLFGDAAARVARLASEGYLADTAAWNNVVDALRELGRHLPDDEMTSTPNRSPKP